MSIQVFPATIRIIEEQDPRFDQWALIVGVTMLLPSGLPLRPCFVAQYPDGDIEYIAVASESTYELGYRT
jgi:hypothetical protein